jgi:hypothetical protein
MAALQPYIGSNPAANAEFSITVPAGKFWKVLSVTVSLVQGATQTPQPILVIDDGTNVLFESFGATGAQSASTTARYSWVAGGPQPAALVGTTPNIHAVAPLPSGLVLPPGSRIQSSTLGKGAATDYAAPALLIVEYDVQPAL